MMGVPGPQRHPDQAPGKEPGMFARRSLFLIRPVLLGSLISLSTMLGGAMPAQASDMWYGVVTVKQVINRPRERKPLEPINDDFPSFEIIQEFKVWKGTLRLLPNNKAVSSLSYRGERAYQRTLSKEIKCLTGKKGTYRDTEKHYSKMSGAGEFESAEPLHMPLNPDGSYGATVVIQSDGINNAVMRTRSDRDTFNSCHKDPHVKKDDDSGPVPAIVVGLSVPITGKAEPDAMEIKGAGQWRDDEEGSVMTASWVLTRKDPKVRAIIQGPKNFKRAATITLDGSKSTGPIKDYTWEFDIDEDCTRPYESDGPRIAKGKSVTMQALCNFSATLTVEGDDTSDSTILSLKVEPRTGKNWKTAYSSTTGSHLTSPIFSDALEMHLGVNQCAFESQKKTGGHYIHTNDLNNGSWKDPGYRVAQVKDAGPFGGLFYVESQKLEVKRVERINANLLPGGDIYKLNQDNNNLADLNALAAQVKAHEKGHSTLMELALRELGDEGDPARRIEAVVDLSEEDVVEVADSIVREANVFLLEATSEKNVQNLLRGQGFTREVSVWFPLLTRPDQPIKKNMGILSDIGETN